MSPSSSPAIIEQLRRGTWFAGLPQELQQLIVERAHLRSYDRGEVLSREGENARDMFVVLEGRARVLRQADLPHEVTFHVAEPGFWFGAIGLFADLPNVVTVVAVEPSKALVLDKVAFEQIVDIEPLYFRDLARLVLERYATLIGFASEAIAMPAEARLRRRLASLAQLRRLEDQGTDSCVLNISQSDLADMIGVSRQRLNRMLKELEAQGLIELPARRIRIVDLAALT